MTRKKRAPSFLKPRKVGPKLPTPKPMKTKLEPVKTAPEPPKKRRKGVD